MLKTYFVDSYYKIDDEEWQTCGKRGYAIKDDSSPETIIKLDKVGWGIISEWLEKTNVSLDGIVAGETFFRHRSYIKIYRGWFDDYPRRLYQNDFKEFSYMDVYTEWNDCSLEWIMKHASAEQTIQYMKERGMTVCPMQ